MNKIVVLTDGLGPYRIELYDYLYNFFKEKKIKFEVWAEGDEKYNKTWIYEDYKRDYTRLLKGIKIKFKGIDFHINPEVKTLIKKEKIDYTIVAGSWSNPTNYLIDRKKTKILFWSESNLLGLKRTNKLEEIVWSFFRTRFYRRINYFLVPGERAKEAVIKWRRKDELPYFIEFPNTIEEIKTTNNIEKNIKKTETKKFLIVARLTKVKGIVEFLENAMEVIKSQNIEIIIAGKGELENKIKEIIIKNGVQEKIKLLGFVNSKELKKIYEEIHFFILPSLYDPSPLAAIEALYNGLPILISKNVGNLPEVLDNNGYNFDCLSQNEVTKVLNNILSWTDEEYKKAQKKSHDIYNSKFNKEKIVLNLYQNLLNIEKGEI